MEKRETRTRYSSEQKLEILREAQQPGVTVSEVPFARLPAPPAADAAPRLPGESDWDYYRRRRQEHEALETAARAQGDLAEAGRELARAEMAFRQYWNAVLRDVFQFPERGDMLFDIPEDPKKESPGP